MKAGGVSDMTNNMGVQGVCVGGGGVSDVGNMAGSSTMASILPKKRRRKKTVSSLVKIN